MHLNACSASSHCLNQCCLMSQWNSNRNLKLFIHENAFENVVCEMAVSWSISCVLIKVWLRRCQLTRSINPSTFWNIIRRRFYIARSLLCDRFYSCLPDRIYTKLSVIKKRIHPQARIRLSNYYCQSPFHGRKIYNGLKKYTGTLHI